MQMHNNLINVYSVRRPKQFKTQAHKNIKLMDKTISVCLGQYGVRIMESNKFENKFPVCTALMFRPWFFVRTVKNNYKLFNIIYCSRVIYRCSKINVLTIEIS